jgi:epoxyqueuosine reductase
MNLLLHICCGPCAIYPVAQMINDGMRVSGYFYNPNIHPYREFKQRIQGVRQFAQMTRLEIEIDAKYGLTEYLRKVVFHEHERCALCYGMRLEEVAQKAKKMDADAFSTTLLYSKYQNHEDIKKIGVEIGEKYQIGFYYQDFRSGWQEGIETALEMNLYRQAYCGCIYSEQERYDKAFSKKNQIIQTP